MFCAGVPREPSMPRLLPPFESLISVMFRVRGEGPMQVAWASDTKVCSRKRSSNIAKTRRR